jgi:hypothetical protein
MWYFYWARWPQVAHVWFSAVDELSFRRTVYQIAASLIKCDLVVSSLLSSAFDIFFHNSNSRTSSFAQVCHKRKWNHYCFVLWTWIVVSTRSQNWVSLSASNMSFKEPSQDMSMSCTCSQVVSPETLLAANELLIHTHILRRTRL